ncbi:hypothetical protein V866_002114 [Kwoniella sp. B9012]
MRDKKLPSAIISNSIGTGASSSSSTNKAKDDGVNLKMDLKSCVAFGIFLWSIGIVSLYYIFLGMPYIQ